MTFAFVVFCVVLIGVVWLVCIAAFVRDLIVNWHRPANPCAQRRVMEHRRVNDRRRSA